RHAPVQVASNGAWLQATFEEVHREAIDVGPPVLLVLDEVDERLLELWQIQIEVLGFALFEWGLGIQPRMWSDQILGLEQTAAVLALIAACQRVMAVWALAFDVRVGQETLGF